MDRRRNRVKDRLAWAIILKAALFKLQGPYASEEEEVFDFNGVNDHMGR